MATLNGLTLGTVTHEIFYKKSGIIVSGIPTTDSEDAFVEDLGGNVLTLDINGNLKDTIQITQMGDLLNLIQGSQPTSITYISDKFGSILVKIRDMRFPAQSISPTIIPYMIKLVVTSQFPAP